MDDDQEYEELVRILEPFRNVRIETGPVALSEDYLRMVEEVESAPENQSGTNKTWVERAQREFREYFIRVAREN
jgi:hypothetical protein